MSGLNRTTGLMAVVMITLISAGCSSYVVPGPAADMRAFGVMSPQQRDELTDHDIQEILQFFGSLLIKLSLVFVLTPRLS